MLQTKQHYENQIQDFQDGEFLCSTPSIQPCRILKPSILNKSSMHSLTLSDNMLTQLPIIAQNIQKIDLSRNRITQFPLNLPNLKQLVLNNNLITRIPQQINDLLFLKILRINQNKITIIPLLNYIRHLQINNNPIKLITTKLIESKLQHLQFDWIQFLVNILLEGTPQQIFYALCDVIQQTKKEYIQKQKIINAQKSQRYQIQELGSFVGFQILFQNRKKNSGLQLEYLLHKAIQAKMNFFIEYLKQFYPEINYNSMKYNDKFLLQQVLQYRNQNQQALQLFKLRKSNIAQSQIYINNLALTCQYNNIQFFTYLIGNGLKRHIIQQNEFELLQIIFKSFDTNLQSQKILIKILQLSGFDSQNKKVFHLPRNYTILQADCICEGIIYVFQNKKIEEMFDFTSAVQDDILQPLLHFGMMVRKPQLVKIVLQKFNKPFVKNYAGKLAKTIRGSLFSRKLIWKYQKRYIKNQLQSNIVYRQQLSDKKRATSQRWLDIIYNKKTPGKFGSPIIKQRYPQNTLMGPKIQSIQKSLQQRYMLNKHHQSPYSQYSMFGESIQDQTGIIYDYSINAQKKSKVLKRTKTQLRICQQMNSLSIYQAYQKSQMQNMKKDYQVKFKITVDSPKTSSFSLSPWTICHGVQINQADKQLTIKSRDTVPSLSMCRDPCQNLNEQTDILI